MGCLLDALGHAYRMLGFDEASGGDEVFGQLVLARIIEPVSKADSAPSGPLQSGLFEAPPGLVHAGSPPEAKVALSGALFAARKNVYAARWEKTRTGKAGWLPSVRGGVLPYGVISRSTGPGWLVHTATPRWSPG
jgi:hypothetical protein